MTSSCCWVAAGHWTALGGPLVPDRVAGLILVLTCIYLVMPQRGRISSRHALVEGFTVGLLWEATRSHPALVFFDAVGGGCGLRIARDHDHWSLEPRDRQNHPIARRASDCRVPAISGR